MTDIEAVEIIKVARAEVEWEYPMEYAAAFDRAIEVLEQGSVLDKIKIEIADIYCGQYCENSLTPYAVREAALEIVDKYRAERLFEG